MENRSRWKNLLPDLPAKVNPDHNPQKKLLYGCSGSGKSTLFRKLMLAGGYAFLYVFDWDLKFARATGFKAACTMEGCCQLQDMGRPVLFWPGKMFPDMKEGFAWWCRFVFLQSQDKKGKKLFGCDEVQECVPANWNALPESVSKIFNYGRNEEIDFCLTAQNLWGVNPGLKAQTTEIFIFKHADMNETSFKKFEPLGIDPNRVKALPFPPLDQRVGWIWKHCLTGEIEYVNHAINGATKRSR